MKTKAIAALSLLIALGACSDLNPYDRSEYETAEKPISESTNLSVGEINETNPSGRQNNRQNNGWGNQTELASGNPTASERREADREEALKQFSSRQ